MAGRICSSQPRRAWNIGPHDLQSGECRRVLSNNFIDLYWYRAWALLTDFVRPKDLNVPAPPNEYSASDLSCAAFMFKYVQVDMELVKHAFDLVSQCRRLPVMLEAFLGTISSSVALSEY